MKLYSWFRSSAAFRVRIALNLKGLRYDQEPIALPRAAHRKPEFAALNPQALVPALEEGGQLLTQSLAIIEYLDEIHPAVPMLPKTPLERARVRALSMLIACEIHPINNLRVLKYLTGPMKHTDEERDNWYRHWVEDGLGKFEAMLANGRTGKFCHGDTPGMADCCLVPQVVNGMRFKSDFSRAPTVMRIYEECNQFDAFKQAAPPNQPDAE